MGIKKFEVQISPNAPVYVIGIVSEMVQIPVWTLRKLDQMQIIVPKRVGKNTRFYSYQQICVLKYVNYLLEVKKVNISGIKFILQNQDKEVDYEKLMDKIT